MCKLTKALYGLKQVPRAWYQNLSASRLYQDLLIQRLTRECFSSLLNITKSLYWFMWMISLLLQVTKFMCNVTKALYGFKQATKIWYQKLSASLLDVRFVNSKNDTSMFFRFTRHNKTIVLVHVDDIIVTGSNKVYLYQMVTLLNTKLPLKDLGDIHFFLEIEVRRYPNTFHLCQNNTLNNFLL